MNLFSGMAVRRKTLIRTAFVGLAGALAVASIAWACAAHDGGTPIQLEIRPSAVPQAEHQVSLAKGVSYDFEASNLANNTFFSVRYSKANLVTTGLQNTCGGTTATGTNKVQVGSATTGASQTVLTFANHIVPSTIASGAYHACVVQSNGAFATTYEVAVL